MLEVRNLDVHYRGIQALRGVDLTVKKGEIFALIGPNGAGQVEPRERAFRGGGIERRDPVRG